MILGFAKKFYRKKLFFYFVVYCKNYASHHEGPLLVGFGVWGLDFLGCKNSLGFNLVF